MNATLHLRLRSDLQALSLATEQLRDFFGRRQVRKDAAYAMELALEELATNIIEHGSNGKNERDIEATVRLDDESVVLEIQDDGCEFNPFAHPVPDTSLSADERPIGGLGIHFVRNLVDDCEYTRSGEKNIVRVKKLFSMDGANGDCS